MLDETIANIAEVALTKLPKCLLVKFRDATWVISDDLGGAGALPVYPKTGYWDRAPGASVRRVGFPLVPSLGGTAHSFTGTTLKSAILDLLHPTRTPRFDDVPNSYVGMSRVRDAATLLLAQPLAPCLFRMGPQPGPTLLLQCLEGKLTKAELEKAWARAEGGSAQKRVVRRLADLCLPCGACLKEKPIDAYTVVPPPGTSGQWFPAWTLVEAEAWRRCKTCSVQQHAPTATQLKPTDTLTCYKCGKDQPRTHYDKSTIDSLQTADSLLRAVCLICDPSSLRTQMEGGDATYQCGRCERNLPARAFDLAGFNIRKIGVV